LDESEFVDLFLFTSEYLSSRGYYHYEVSNFALGRSHTAIHNMRYWKRRPYLGLGPSAHSHLGRKRWWNVVSIRQYMGLLKGGRLPIEGIETLSPAQESLERLGLGLRTVEGVPLTALKGISLDPKRVQAFAGSGHLRVRGGRLCPTPLGLLVSDALPVEILA
jgi:oxygen-independent coproporphyrinogen-3 oxidase